MSDVAQDESNTIFPESLSHQDEMEDEEQESYDNEEKEYDDEELVYDLDPFRNTLNQRLSEEVAVVEWIAPAEMMHDPNHEGKKQ